MEFTSVFDIEKHASAIKDVVKQAILIQNSNEKIVIEKKRGPIPRELKAAFAEDPKLKKAFDELTPGRRRGCLLYISDAKQSATRDARIEKMRSKDHGWQRLE